jgi:predicted O-linked N-acetylglucosamine transferase (SPINDLY family)
VLRLFLLPLFRTHDRSQVEVFAYSAVRTPDVCTEDLKAHVDVWRDVSKLDERAIAAMIHEDRIDVLVDLSMHVAGSRIGAFTYKPAPVQLCWLAYPGTTGLEAMDYRVSDPHLDPEGSEVPSVEKVLRLPESIWCYDPDVEMPEVNALPALSSGVVTFGSLNIFAKLNAGVLDLWTRVLSAVPGSRLLLHAPEGWARQFATEVFAARGLSSDRVEFIGRQGRMDYLATYHRIDVFLDSFPYGGHTTALESFLMGVPAVVMPGDTPVSRGGVSVAATLGLGEFVAQSPDEYVRIACQWANDPNALIELRSQLRARVLASPLMQPARFTHHFEQALREAWRNYCAS